MALFCDVTETQTINKSYFHFTTISEIVILLMLVVFFIKKDSLICTGQKTQLCLVVNMLNFKVQAVPDTVCPIVVIRGVTDQIRKEERRNSPPYRG